MRFQALDSWRGLCAAMIVVFHLDQAVNWSFQGAPWVQNFHFFVDFFFVLSGFVISASAERQLAGGDGFVSFLLRRFGRIYPLHLAMLCVLLAYTAFRVVTVGVGEAFDGGIYSFHGIFTNLLLLQGVGFERHFTWNFPSWSISAEFWTYVLFALIWRFGGRFANWLAYALIVLCPLALYLAPHQDVLSVLTWVTCVYGFAAGVAVQHAYKRFGAQVAQALTRLKLATLLEALTVVGCFAFVMLRGEAKVVEYAPAVFASAVFAFALEAGALSRLLRAAPFVGLGALSYSIYMTHAVIIMLAWPVTGWLASLGLRLTTEGGAQGLWGAEVWIGDLVMAGGLALVIAVSAATYPLIEKPGRDWGRRLAAQWQARRAATPPTASSEPVA